MNLYGVLGQYIPNFGRIVGRMQYDLFHAYTVDAHTLFVVSNLRRFALRRFDHEFPRCSEIMQGLPKQEIAYLAGLFHDIAKGRGGDHSELGAVSAEAFCLEHGMSLYDARLVAWLVKNHLLLSLTAQKKDINDPEIIREFAHLVGDETHLDYLYLLTVADVRATNPKLWNSWKAQLFQETYDSTKRALRQGLETPVEKDELLREKCSRALELLSGSEISAGNAQDLWTRLGDEYLLRCKPEEIAWHTRMLMSNDEGDAQTLVAISDTVGGAGTDVFIYAPQGQFTFAIATAVLDEYGISIAEARIIALDNNQSVSMYTILEQDGRDISEASRQEKIKQRLTAAIRAGEDATLQITRKVPRQVRMFSTATQVDFAADRANQRTVMELTAGDKPGLLAETGKALRDENVFIRMAKIVTVGERAEDVFYITDSHGHMLTNEQEESLRERLKQAIDRNN